MCLWKLLPRLFATLFLFCVEAEGADAPAGAGPKNLFREQWRTESGKWDVNPGSAIGAAEEQLGELSAARAVPLAGRWISFRLLLAGPAAKAGVRFSGVADARGEILRFSAEAASGTLTNGRGKELAGLGDLQLAVELVLKFGTDRVGVYRSGAQLCELPITYTEPEATLSLFVERGTATFGDLLLSTPVVAAPVAAVPAPAPPPRERAKKVATERMSIDLTAGQALPLAGDWNDYMGIHFTTEPGPWKMVRHLDGPEFGFPPRGRHTGDVKTFEGPFTRQGVEISLADFRDWKRKDSRGLDENLRALIDRNQSALFIAPWAAPFTPAQQDHVWALMKLIYGGQPGAEGRVFFQWGDDINYRRLGAAANTKVLSSEPRGGGSMGRGANAVPDAQAYAEHYFAPAVEATRRASEEIFRNPRAIPILIGSCARSSSAENREWYGGMLEHQLTGASAPSLAGQRVIDLVDYLTVNYPFDSARDATGLQELWDRYGGKVKGLWITEEFGTSGRKAGVLLERLGLFLEWAARNRLDAQQTRILWNVPVGERDRLGVSGLLQRLGEKLGGAPLQVTAQEVDSGRIYRVAAGESRFLLWHVPSADRRKRKAANIGELAIQPPAALAGKKWEARFMVLNEKRADVEGAMVPVDQRDGKLLLSVATKSLDSWALLLEAL
jgi:hypothetical protein